MTRLTGRAGLSAFLLAFIAVTAFALAEQTSAMDPTRAASPTGSDTQVVELPLDPYMLSFEELDLLDEARGSAIRSCLLRHGYDLAANDRAARPALPNTVNERRYGASDESQAASYGYALEERAPFVAAPSAPFLQDPTSDSVAVTEPMRAVSVADQERDRCVREAEAQLTAPSHPAASWDLAQRLSAQSFAQAREDSDVKAALRAWSACMELHGYFYSDPLEAAGDPRFAGEKSLLEVQTAMRDIACSRKTDLVARWSSVEVRYQAVHLNDNRTDLELLRESNKSQLQRAKELLARGD